MPRLIILNGTEPAGIIELTESELLIGRQKGAQILLEGPKVSRRHARIFLGNNEFRVEDLGSSNGTFLNGERLKLPTTLKGSDEIGIGPYRLRYEGGEASPDVTIRARDGGEHRKRGAFSRQRRTQAAGDFAAILGPGPFA
jgi:pSer/pThr/pTyr-binding forkhead associated (FHA) protein